MKKRKVRDNSYQIDLFGVVKMVKTSKFKTAQYMSAKNDGEYNGKTLTIDSVYSSLVGQVGEEKEKLLIRFSGVDKPLVLNQTNIAILETAYGDDTDLWVNNKVSFNLVTVMYNGSPTLGIQLNPKK